MESSDKNMLSFLREEVKCAICLNRLKNPRLLICIHSFCEDCLETYYKKENSSVGKIACPVCDENTVLSDAGISGLRRDFRAIGLMDRMVNDKEKMQQQKAKKGLQLCEVCGHVEQAATSFYNCQECKLALCNECGTAHKHPVLLSTYHVDGDGLDLQDADDQDKVIFCERHDGKKKELFCKLCLIPVCDLCFIRDHRLQENHDCVKVEEFIPVMRKEIQSRLSSLTEAYKSYLRFVLGDDNLKHGDVYRITNVPGPISDIATDLKDNIYCSVPSCKQICVVRSDGPHFKAILTGNLKPEQIAVCPHCPNQVIFTHDSSKVSVVDLSGKLLRTITRPEWKEVAIGCDNDSILYVLWKNKAGLRTLQRFYLNGDPLKDAIFQEENHDCTRLLLAVSPGGDVAVVTRKDNVTLITTKREFTGEETSLPN
nr:E3 ubiquitin-protein ligase TRIM56-like [Lytechinus pictus]